MTETIAPDLATAVALSGSTARDERSKLAAAIVAETMAAVGRFRCAGAERLTREGISIAHLHVMWLLEQRGDLSMSRLAELLGVSLSNATGLIDRMEERGLVERVRVPDDRRVVLVRGTAHGAETVAAVEVLRRDTLERLLSRLDDDQLVRLQAALRDLAAVLLDAAGASSGCPDGTQPSVQPDASLALSGPSSTPRRAAD